MKEKKLIIMNGSWKGRQHIYIAAYSKADAARICTELSGYSRGWINEINNYFSIGCWGNAMDGIKIERGAWISKDCYNEKPCRALLKNTGTAKGRV